MNHLETSLRLTVEEMCEKMGMILPGCSLNYPSGSLRRMLRLTENNPAAEKTAAERFCVDFSSRFGFISAVPHEGGWCFSLSEEAVQAVMAMPLGGAFLKEICQLSQNHHATVRDWLLTFKRFGPATLIQANDPEYDCLLYYPDGHPVRFVYCLKQDGEHLSVHRLDREDFEELYPEMNLQD